MITCIAIWHGLLLQSEIITSHEGPKLTPSHDTKAMLKHVSTINKCDWIYENRPYRHKK